LTVLQTFENELAPDKAKPQIGQLSDLGLVEMTRHRQGQSLSEIFTRRCTSCNGTGHALEEFSWMHTGGDGDSRGRQGGRNKLPVRQPNRMQQVPKPAASLSQKKDKARVALGNLAEAAGQKKEAQSNVTPGNILLNNLAGKKQGQAVEPQESLAEYFGDKTYKATGVRLSNVAKLSHMPMAINSVLTRINPKANDIVTLVHSIEAAASMPIPTHMRDFEEEGMEDEEAETAEIPAEAELVTASMPRGRGPRGGRPPAEDRRKDVSDDENQPEAELLDQEEVVQVEREFEHEFEDEPEEAAEKPRRGRAMKRQEEDEGRDEGESVDDMHVLHEPSDEAPDENIDEDFAESVHAEEEDVDVEDSDDDGFDEDDDEDEHEENSPPVAVAKASAGAAAAAKRRKGGRPAKRSIKKPPSKR